MSLAGRNVLVVAPHASAMPLARALADAGARVILQGATKETDEAAKAADSIEALTEPLDNVDHVEALAEKCWSSFGPLAGLVIVPDEAAGDFADSDDDWQIAIRSALQLPFFLARAVAARMADAEGGCIVFVVGAESHLSEGPAINDVTRSASLVMIQALAKALPETVRVCAVTGGADPTACDATGIANTVCFLLSEPSLASGTIVHLRT